MQMIGIGQLHLRPNLFQIGSGHSPLDSRRSPHVHEHRGLDGAVDRLQLRPFRSSFLFQYLVHISLLKKSYYTA